MARGLSGRFAGVSGRDSLHILSFDIQFHTFHAQLGTFVMKEVRENRSMKASLIVLGTLVVALSCYDVEPIAYHADNCLLAQIVN